MLAVVPATPAKPKTPATNARIRNMMVHCNIVISSPLKVPSIFCTIPANLKNQSKYLIIRNIQNLKSPIQFH